jgi:hypothetical protein
MYRINKINSVDSVENSQFRPPVPILKVERQESISARHVCRAVVPLSLSNAPPGLYDASVPFELRASVHSLPTKLQPAGRVGPKVPPTKTLLFRYQIAV